MRRNNTACNAPRSWRGGQQRVSAFEGNKMTRVNCAECGERHSTKTIKVTNVEEDFQGRDVCHFVCPITGQETSSLVFGGAAYEPAPRPEEERHLLGFFGGLAMLGLLIREKSAFGPRKLSEEAMKLAEHMATEHRRICDGTYSE